MLSGIISSRAVHDAAHQHERQANTTQSTAAARRHECSRPQHRLRPSSGIRGHEKTLMATRLIQEKRVLPDPLPVKPHDSHKRWRFQRCPVKVERPITDQVEC